MVYAINSVKISVNRPWDSGVALVVKHPRTRSHHTLWSATKTTHDDWLSRLKCCLAIIGLCACACLFVSSHLRPTQTAALKTIVEFLFLPTFINRGNRRWICEIALATCSYSVFINRDYGETWRISSISAYHVDRVNKAAADVSQPTGKFECAVLRFCGLVKSVQTRASRQQSATGARNTTDVSTEFHSCFERSAALWTLMPHGRSEKNEQFLFNCCNSHVSNDLELYKGAQTVKKPFDGAVWCLPHCWRFSDARLFVPVKPKNTIYGLANCLRLM